MENAIQSRSIDDDLQSLPSPLCNTLKKILELYRRVRRVGEISCRAGGITAFTHPGATSRSGAGAPAAWRAQVTTLACHKEKRESEKEGKERHRSDEEMGALWKKGHVFSLAALAKRTFSS